MSDPKDDDPVVQSLEEAALERARAYVKELEVDAELGDEVAGEPSDAGPAPAPALTREEADAQALAEFQKLRDRSSKKTI
jgi:hypothetical protein